MFTVSRSPIARARGAWLPLAGLLLLNSFTLAGHKGDPHGGSGGGGGGGGSDSSAGTVYFRLWSDGTQSSGVYSMRPDGSDKQPLPANVNINPSHDLHGGHRWFIGFRQIDDLTRPDGTPWVELFAVRDDGDEGFTVQLTFQADLEPTGHYSEDRWLVGDTAISFQGIYWDLATGEPIQAGIYAAEILFDADGNVIGLAQQPDPTDPLVSVPIDARDWDEDGSIDEFQPMLTGFDWSPDGTAVAWASDGQYTVCHLVTIGAVVDDDIARFRVDGGRGGKLENLTDDIGGSAIPLAWR
jgi:hypothetical protein